MIIHTVMPMELVFPSEPGELRLLACSGRQVLARRSAIGWCVERLLSSDPADFLDPRWQPGTPVVGVDAADGPDPALRSDVP